MWFVCLWCSKVLSKDFDDTSSISSLDRDSSFAVDARPSQDGRPTSPPDTLVREVIDENQRLLDENRRLTETYAPLLRTHITENLPKLIDQSDSQMRGAKYMPIKCHSTL